ncbi:unnamed protein product [Cuscuta campestris]|uniref:Uncharacterized protein n=1 Tax=Cuscuta campestris TaxID=132261 RepID=A0A484LFD0_9ASTE|nr:unnamed protein product [Cuscuta campestris]VFQ75138.1 unnamed protein product [Cuscuta campestris]
MADQENCVSARVTRSMAKKRAAETMTAEHIQQRKKRVALAEIYEFPSADPDDIRTLDPKPHISKPNRAKFKTKQVKGTAKKADGGADSESDDPQMCCAYASDIYAYMRQLEAQEKRRPLNDYLEKVQRDVSANMRGILVDWLVEVAEEYKLLPETLYLSVNYIDRFLSVSHISRHKLQLLGVSAMLIASKYEEISPPHVDDFCYITDNTFNQKEVVKMEQDVLKSLKFELGTPTIRSFLMKYIQIAQEDFKTQKVQLEYLGLYLAELSLLDYYCVKFLPSMVAASVIFLSRFTLNPTLHPWNQELQTYTGYTPADLMECVFIIHDLQWSRRGGSLVALREKYKRPKMLSVSALRSPVHIPESWFENPRL